MIKNSTLQALITWSDNFWQKLHNQNQTDRERAVANCPFKIYTQLYPIDSKIAWSVVFEISTPLYRQGRICVADSVYFMFDEAPHALLVDDFEFPFYNGGNVIGNVTLIQDANIDR